LNPEDNAEEARTQESESHGSLATMMLGDLGATVIKVEEPERGDDSRAWGPPYVDGESTYYLSINRNKRSVTLDLRTPEGEAAGRELADRADVVVENFRGGKLTKYSLDYDSVRRTNPGVIYCSVSGFGAGPGASLAGYDFIAQAVGGLMSITGQEDGPATKVGVALVDVLTGLHACIGILAALEARRSTGRGQCVEVNLLSSLISSLINQGSAFANTGVVPRAMGNRHPSVVPYETLRTADGLLAVAVGNDTQFRAARPGRRRAVRGQRGPSPAPWRTCDCSRKRVGFGRRQSVGGENERGRSAVRAHQRHGRRVRARRPAGVGSRYHHAQRRRGSDRPTYEPHPTVRDAGPLRAAAASLGGGQRRCSPMARRAQGTGVTTALSDPLRALVLP
jgi:hypothetical protein